MKLLLLIVLKIYFSKLIFNDNTSHHAPSLTQLSKTFRICQESFEINSVGGTIPGLKYKLVNYFSQITQIFADTIYI